MAVQGATTHNHNIAIGHTRWATHGDKTDVNAHPHLDHRSRIAVVHNGIIGNYHELKKEIKEQYDIEPISGTDTEIVAILIGIELDKNKSLFDAIKSGTERLEGAYSFVLISILEPNNMYLFKNTGTMVIGVSDSLQEQLAQEMDLKTSPQQVKEKDEEEKKDGDEKDQTQHSFQIVASDTTVF
jgi:glucosamine 6-phosphate synthetase-like amidotransferase/phosphosugar isomerase protein